MLIVSNAEDGIPLWQFPDCRDEDYPALWGGAVTPYAARVDTRSAAWQVIGALLSGRGWARQMMATKCRMDARDFEAINEPIAGICYAALMRPITGEAAGEWSHRTEDATLDALDAGDLWDGNDRWLDNGGRTWWAWARWRHTVNRMDGSFVSWNQPPLIYPTEFFAFVAREWQFPAEDHRAMRLDYLAVQDSSEAVRSVHGAATEIRGERLLADKLERLSIEREKARKTGACDVVDAVLKEAA